MIQLLKSKLVLVILLLISYGLSSVMIKYLFVDNSSKINTENVAKVKRDILLTIDNTFNKSQNVAQIRLEESKQRALELAQNGVLKQIAPGIKAAETKNAGYYQINLSDMPYGEYKTYTIGGKTIKVSTLNGVEPSQEVLEAVARYSK